MPRLKPDTSYFPLLLISYNAKAAAFSSGSGFCVPKKAKSQDFTNISQKLYRKIVLEKNRRKFFAVGMLKFYSHSKKC